MCDYCDCRTRPLLAALGADHDRVRSLAGEIERAVADDDRVTMRRAAGELATLLADHSHVEERSLYPELDRAGMPTDGLRAEHASVEATVAAAAQAEDIDADELVSAVGELRDHVFREEYDLFPAAHQLLGDAAWERLAG